MPQHASPQLGLLRWRPGTKTLAGFHAELAVGDELFEIGRWAGPRLDCRQHGLLDRECEIGADEVGVLQRAEHGKAAAERGLDDGVDGLGVADAVLDERDRLAPQRM